MLKFTIVNLLQDTNPTSIHNLYPVDWSKLAASKYNVEGFHKVHEGVEYLLLRYRRNLAMLTRVGNGPVEAVRIAEDLKTIDDVIQTIGRNLEWRHIENGSDTYTLQKPRAFLGRLLGNDGAKVGITEAAEVRVKLQLAKNAVAEARGTIPADDTSIEANNARSVIEVLDVVMNEVQEGLESSETIETIITANEESVQAKPKTLTQAVATINYSGLPRKERIEAFRALLNDDQYAEDKGLATLAANLGEPVAVAA